jgi:uncharacterized membrane protein YhfC
LIGISQINNIAFCLLINSGNEAALSALSAGVLQSAKDTLMSLEPVNVYWGILERFSAVLLHVFVTVLVFRGVREKKAGYYVLKQKMRFDAVGVSDGDNNEKQGKQ